MSKGVRRDRVETPLGNRTGIAANYTLPEALSLDVGYFGEDAPNRPSNPGRDSGLFNGGYSAFAQLVYSGDRLKLGLLYLNSFSQAFGEVKRGWGEVNKYMYCH